MGSFSDTVANDLEEVHMIAGDDKIFVYTIYDETNTKVDVTGASCVVSIFRYGDPDTIFATLTGSSGGLAGTFTVHFPYTSSSALSGVYQQQLKITDIDGVVHIPSQGKIVVFPSAG